MTQELRVKTALGTLIAKEVDNQDYPGIDIGIQRPDGSIYWCLLAEVPKRKVDDDKKSTLKLWHYEPGDDEANPISQYTGDEIDRHWKEYYK